MKKIFLITTLIFSVLSFTIYIQTNFSEIIQHKLEDYNQNKTPEKVYIHTDKPFYALDDDIWFTAYLVNGITHQKTEKSKILHVELINPKDSIVAHRKLYVNEISVAGDIKIESYWQPGQYLLRGYTQYMRNQDEGYFFQKEIPIYNIQKDSIAKKNILVNSKQTNNLKTLTKPELSFYPEGGYIINNLPNRIAFKVNNNLDFKGILKNENGTEITEIKTIDFGLGNFVLNPKPNNNYYISTFINGKEEKYKLPKPLNSGHTLNVTNTGNTIIISAKSTLTNGLQNTYLVAHERGKMLFKNFESTNKSSYIVKIPTQSLVNGIVNITLFNNDGHPVAERTVFIDNQKNNLKLNINTSKETYTSRKKVSVKIDVINKDSLKQTSTLSMAVRDLKAYPYNSRSPNIKTYLLLNSDLRGRLENPNYFFEKENDAKRRYLLDLIMMTNGWKRFTWQELLTSKDSIQKFQPEKGIFISGTVKKLKKPYTPHKAPLRLTFLGGFFTQEPLKMSDSIGHFVFGPYGFMDTIPMLLESRLDNFYNKDPKSRNVAILLDKPIQSPKISRKNVQANDTNDKQQENFVKVTQYIQQIKFEHNQQVQKLKAVELKAKRKTEEDRRKTEMNERTTYGSVGLGGSKRLDVTKLKGIGSLSAYQLLMQLGGVYTSQGNIFLMRTQSQPKILLDGMEIDAGFLKSINGFEISFIDLLVGGDANLVTNGGGNGVIVLYSKSGNEGKNGVKRQPGIIDFDAIGFYTAREFFAPDHINGFEEINNYDIRTTLHWHPIINTSNNKTTEISFFTSDLKTDYLIEIEGITATGQPIHAIKTFNVE
ncbi:hypothetical protein [Wenyingzhuangia sp. IMCC45467]